MQLATPGPILIMVIAVFTLSHLLIHILDLVLLVDQSTAEITEIGYFNKQQLDIHLKS